ncbi:MAG: DUF2085 domain-containing protein, partial [Vicinamibacterales bacterium]
MTIVNRQSFSQLPIPNPAILSRLLVVSSFVWLGAIFIAPFGFDLPYLFGSFICHQHPARSFWIAGSPMPVCA